MLKPVSIRKSLLACLADCAAAVPFGGNLRTIAPASSHSFYTRRYLQAKKTITTMRKVICTLIFLTIFSGCSPLKRISDKEVQKISDYNDFKRFNGSFRLLRNDPHDIVLSLEDIFYFKTDYHNGNRADSTYRMKLNFLDEKTLQADLYIMDSLIETKVVKGKIRKNHFVLRDHFEVPHFYLLFNFYRSSKSRIALLPNGNLTADFASGGCGLLVLFPVMCAGTDNYNLTYDRIKASR